MIILEAKDDRLVIQNLDPAKRKWIAKCLIAVILIIGIMTKWIGFISVPMIILLCVMLSGFLTGKVTEYTFDGPLKQLRLRRKSMISANSESEVVPFADLRKVIYRDASLARSDRKIYQMVITAVSHNSMVIGATDDLERCKNAIQRVNALLGRKLAVELETLTKQEEENLEE